MAVVPGGPRSGPAAGAHFFCTAGRGLEPFLMREVRERLAATQVEYISGKVFFTTCSDLNMLKQLKSAERLFLLIKKQLPFPVSSVNKGKIFNELQRLINDDPESWLNAISIWKNFLELDAEKEKLSHKNANPLKRKVGEDDISAKKLKTEQIQEIQETKECQLEKQIEEKILEQGNFITEGEKFQEELQNDITEAADTRNQSNLTFRVSCRCSGAIAKIITAQEVGRVIGIALMKQFGWKADLRNPNLEACGIIFLSLFSIFKINLMSHAKCVSFTAVLQNTLTLRMFSYKCVFLHLPLTLLCGIGRLGNLNQSLLSSLLEPVNLYPDSKSLDIILFTGSFSLQSLHQDTRVEIYHSLGSGLPRRNQGKEPVLVPFN
ncbi:hypothetical protein FD755_008952 [Muntiacus reevesi]|uniref:Uncharacterized protein n=1 Tax=Muntiacus reevesi TaxID=9886 RepID=A0A5J5MQY8_MUNRE|nr:hypothetical protein FD755_008952 [Muntiacus reevesi]